MGARRSGRETALKVLYQIEASSEDPRVALARFWDHFEADPEGRAYADAIVLGVTECLDAVDARIRQASKNWRLERMTRVDRNLLRAAAWELEHQLEVPRAVIIDEAIELAKSFGSEDSPAFINGILDRIATDLGRVDGAGQAD